jgi:hypothetical protein
MTDEQFEELRVILLEHTRALSAITTALISGDPTPTPPRSSPQTPTPSSPPVAL